MAWLPISEVVVLIWYTTRASAPSGSTCPRVRNAKLVKRFVKQSLVDDTLKKGKGFHSYCLNLVNSFVSVTSVLWEAAADQGQWYKLLYFLLRIQTINDSNNEMVDQFIYLIIHKPMPYKVLISCSKYKQIWIYFIFLFIPTFEPILYKQKR